jgi:hypothetical protein
VQVICSVTLTLNSISVMFTGVGYIGGSLSDVITQPTSGVVSEASSSTKKLYIVGGKGAYYAIAHTSCSDQADTFVNHMSNAHYSYMPMYANTPICTSANSGTIANVMLRASERSLKVLLLAGHGNNWTGGSVGPTGTWIDDDGCVLCLTGEPTTVFKASGHTLIVSTKDCFSRRFGALTPTEDACILEKLPANCLQGVDLVLVTGCGVGVPQGGPPPPNSIAAWLTQWLGARYVVCAGENNVHDLQLMWWLNGGDSVTGFLDEIAITSPSTALGLCKDVSDGGGGIVPWLDMQSYGTGNGGGSVLPT